MDDIQPTRRRPRRLVSRDRIIFERLVGQALQELPRDILDALENIAVVVEDEPTPELLQSMGMGEDETLYGLYQGIPLTQRVASYSMVLPDKITIYRKPIEEVSRTYGEMKAIVKDTVRHEVAHYFGFSDADLPQ